MGRCLLLTAVLLPACASAAPAQEAAKAQVRLDAHGDLLPPGALARLGRVDPFRQGSGARCLALSPDGKLLATGGADGTVRLWDATTCKEVRSWEAHDKAIRALAFAPDGKTLATAGDDGKVRLWDA